MTRRKQPPPSLDGSACPTCGGVLVGHGFGFFCLDCRTQWQFNLHPDADLSKPGFPIVRRERRMSEGEA